MAKGKIFKSRRRVELKREIEEEQHGYYDAAPSSSQQSQGSIGGTNEDSGVPGPHQLVWPFSYAVFQAHAASQSDGGARLLEDARWKCCNCGYYNAMPAHGLRLMHCRNPEGCVVNPGTLQVHAGPASCCAIVGPEGAWTPMDVLDLRFRSEEAMMGARGD
ncbi:uncharacterized protein CLUP02_02561 [Colletotrichum lupini]|uniref:Uncharacterized protein n=1 Tax=Colletotrichum lupini TaxID=145971 RepID=A0A9Q8WBD4_9PEZI|nr:uncharacterized protein CLUP02_02561 [Colletotrichum lupini]KAK1706891.1 hypothetical protein BDP67DRAFT_582217 [Colletotrichum lupini]UQC77094.1 hypothetical protein CLUP02_02561 [Colletotrichum lupini]